MGRKLSADEASSLGLETPAPRGRKLSAHEVGALGLDQAGEGGAGGEVGSTPSPADGETQQGTHPDPRFKYEEGEKGPLAAATTGFTQGLTFDHGPQLGGVLDAAIGQDSYQNSVDRSTELDRQLKEEHPWLYGGGRVFGSVLGLGKLGAATKLGTAFQAAKGLGGVLGRVGAAAGLGGLAGALEGEGRSRAPLGSEEWKNDVAGGAKWGAAAGGAGQAIIGEPIRGITGALGNQIDRVDAKTGELADAEIASAQGLRGKQGQEAVGGRRNLELEAMMERAAGGAPQGSPPPPSRPLGLPPGARMGDPLYHVQGATPEQAKRLLIEQFRMVHEQADDFIANEAAPYLARAKGPAIDATRAGRVRPAGGPAQEALNELGSARDDLKQRGIDNALRAIREEQNNPIEIPGRDTAMGNAVRQQNAQAWAEGKRGAGEVGAGAFLKAIGNPMGAGSYNMGRGVRRIAGAALSAPAVMNRLRAIPGIGRAIGSSAGRGSAALAATLYAMSADPKVAAELQKMDGELAQSEEQ